jgi:hypothetical protein
MQTVREVRSRRNLLFALALWVSVVPLFAALAHACGCKTEQPCACCQKGTIVQNHRQASCCATQTTAEQATPACCTTETPTTERSIKPFRVAVHSDESCGDCHFCGNNAQLPDLNRSEQTKAFYPQGTALLPRWTLDFSLQTQPYPVRFSENANHSPPLHNRSPRAPPFFLMLPL